jgi:putative copper export protein/methionine-rich copper-binding protein CopC/ketosteroid isomerase-like protein
MTRFLLKGSLAATFLLLVLTTSLSAHPRLLKASPGVGESLLASPTEIRLTFSLSVNPALSQMELFGPSGVLHLDALAGHPDSTNVLIAGISGALGEGEFVVRWTVVGDDGHPVEGEYPFHLTLGSGEASGAAADDVQGEALPRDRGAAANAPELSAQSEEDPGGSLGVESPVYVLVRWVNFAGIIGTIGAVAFGLLVLPLAAFRTGRKLEGPIRWRPAQVGLASAAIVLIGAGARLLAQRAAVFGTAATINFGQGSGALLSTAWGAGWILQILAGSAALVGFRLSRSHPRIGWGLALLGALLLSLTPALSGHAVSAEGSGFLPILADTLHVIGAGGWIGGLFVLLLTAFRVENGEDRDSIRLADLVRAFSPTALVFAGVLVLTGVFGAWTQLGSFSALWSSGYGRVFLLKVAILIPVFATGAYNALRLRPALARGEGDDRFQWSAGLELAGTSLVLLVTSVLVATPTPLHGSAEVPTSSEVTQVVQAFHRALASGDSVKIIQLLADDVRVLEGGGLETREEYVSHHLAADMAFASAVERVQGPIEVDVEGDVAWATSTNQTKGMLRERPINSEGAELVVLTREGGEWRIRAIHWSSRQVS